MNSQMDRKQKIRREWNMIWKLSKNDFKTKFAGSHLGILWAFIQPVVTIMVYWFIFEIGFRSANTTLPVPFLLYLVAGIVPWFFFQDALMGGTNSLLEYNYLVKKVVFQIEILPAVKITAALFVHAFFVCFITGMYLVYGRIPTLHYIQIFYYSGALAILVLGMSYLTSAVVIFFRDLSQIIAILLQVGVWMTPIMWIAEEKLANHPMIWKVLKLNPVYYVVSGYRDAFIYQRWFWQRPLWTLYFWCAAIGMLLFGKWVFKRLKVHFADVL